jgi:hypothetical protein
MNTQTTEQLRNKAIEFINQHPTNLDAAHSAFVQYSQTQFQSNAGGLSRPDWDREVGNIWDSAKQQHQSRPGQQGSEQRTGSGR